MILDINKHLVFILLVITGIFGLGMPFLPSMNVMALTTPTISIDSPVYVLDDNVIISGSVIPIINDNVLYIEIENPQGLQRLWHTTSDANGNFQTTYPLTEKGWLNGGTYKISVLRANNVLVSTNFVLLSNNNVVIPLAMSDITKQWRLGKITDVEFLENVQFLINNHSLVIPVVASSSQIQPPLSDKFRSDVISWLGGRNDDIAFGKSLELLFNAGYLPVQITSDFSPALGSLLAYPHEATSNTNVIFIAPNTNTQYDDGQVIHFSGQVISNIGTSPNGIPNAPYQIVDADNNQIITQGSTTNDGTFQFDWTVQSSGKSERSLKVIFPGQGGLQMSQSNSVKIRITPTAVTPPVVTPPTTTPPVVTPPTTTTPPVVTPPTTTPPVVTPPTTTPPVVTPPTTSKLQEATSSPSTAVNAPTNTGIPPIQNQTSQFDWSPVILGTLFFIIIFVYIIYRRLIKGSQYRTPSQKPQKPTFQPTPFSQRTPYVQPAPYVQPTSYSGSRTPVKGSRSTSPSSSYQPSQQYSPITSTGNSWPMNSDYRLSFMNLKKLGKNSEIKSATLVPGKNGAPILGTGNFGGVYKIRVGINQYALKYFTRSSSDREERYSQIDKYLKSNLQNGISDFLIHFDYLRDAITVNGSTYPLLKMEWVDGMTLHKYIENNSKNKKSLIDLAEKFIDCVETIQLNNIAHGDLSEGNVMVKNGPQIKLKLIDYDCMFIPQFAGKSPPEDGNVNYQHPKRRIGKYYNKKLDNFSALVIYLMLYAIAEDPQGLSKYHEEGIFIRKDFDDPRNSSVIKQLNKSKSNKVRQLTNLLLDALNHDPIWDGIDPAKLKAIQ